MYILTIPLYDQIMDAIFPDWQNTTLILKTMESLAAIRYATFLPGCLSRSLQQEDALGIIQGNKTKYSNVEKLQAYYEPVKKMMENLYTYVPTLLANFNNHPALVLAWQEIQLIYFLLQNTLFDLKIIHSFNPQHFLAGLAIIIQNLEQFQNHYAFHNKQSFIINNLLMCAFAIQKKCLQKQQNQNLGFLDKTLLSQIGKAELSVHFYAALRDPRNLQADEIILGSWLEQLLQLLHPDSTTEEASTSLFDNALASSRTNFGTK